MEHHGFPRRARFGRPICAVLAALVLVGGAATLAPQPSAASRHKSSGPVDVLYAGSLVNVMEQAIGPAFDGATGYTFSGFSAGSSALANDVKGGIEQGDVLISASPAINASLEGTANGSWVSWYALFAASPLVIAYNPASKFAAQLKSQPWYRVVAEPGFLLGRTDPVADPKGVLANEALEQAASTYHVPALDQLANSTAGVYPEQTLVGRLQAGQLDAGFFYSSEAAAAGLPTVPLGTIRLSADYTVTVLDRAPHRAAATAFVKYLFGREGRSILAHDGLTLTTPPTVTGSKRVPKALRATLHLP